MPPPGDDPVPTFDIASALRRADDNACETRDAREQRCE
jgi:hypothetical protein